MDNPGGPRPFAAISGRMVHRALNDCEKKTIGLVEYGYQLHGNGMTVNPPSYFLRFPEDPSNRIIALPASVGGDVGVAGVKWISSFPANVDRGVPRASAVIVLNDLATGYPIACLEGSIISAARTAASTALAASRLSEGRPPLRRLGVIGTGLIARYIHAYLVASGFALEEIGLYDESPEHAAGFAGHIRRSGDAHVTIHATAESLIRSADLLVFATTAGAPHIMNPAWFAHTPLVLHISLRDLGADVVLSACNIVDDVEHCLKAETSLHLVERALGNRTHVDATLYDVLNGSFTVPTDRTVVFSPFGLGVLDLVLAAHVYEEVMGVNGAVVVDDFFYEMSRYGVAE